MHITYLTIFPELFDSFRETTLISRAVQQQLIHFETINPRHFCDDKHRVIDDEIYGGGHGLLMKAPPIIAAIKHWIEKHNLRKKPKTSDQNWNFRIILPHPAPTTFVQMHAHQRSESSHLLFVCGRYEGIDERVRLWLQKHYPRQSQRVSLGQFVTLGGELPAMTMTEAIVRLVPWVIHSEASRQEESYSISQSETTIEHPQYTRPEVVEGMRVPEVLLSGHHQKIQQWKQDHTQILP